MPYLVKYNTTEAILPKRADNVPYLIEHNSFSFSKRLDGNEIVSFDVFTPENQEDIQAGDILFVYGDVELQILLFSFIVQNRVLKLDGGEEFKQQRLYSVTGISTSDLLNRQKLSFTYRNIRFKDLLTNLINLYRVKVPEISTDTQFIQDLDFVFPIFGKVNKTFTEILEFLRSQGYQAFLRPDLKLQAGERAFLPHFNVDLDNSAIDDERHVVRRGGKSKLGEKFKELPITSIVAIGGQSTEGAFTTANAITNKESNYDLLEKVNTEANFILEPFNTISLQGFETRSLTGIGWNNRYALYNTPVNFNTYQLLEIGLQILENKEAYFLGISKGDNLSPSRQYSGFYFNNGVLNLIVNQELIPTPEVLKPFRDLEVLSIDFDTNTVELADISDLAVGDKISIGGNNTTVSLATGTITAIDGNFLTVDEEILTGEVNGNVRLLRVTPYELRLLINGAGNTEYLIRNGQGDYRQLGEYLVNYPSNVFATAFNCREEPIPTVDNGIWEVGGYAVDYFFFDTAKLIKAYDENNKKLVLSTEEQSSIVLVDAVVNSIDKNGKSISQLQFIAPSLIKFIPVNRNITLSRIPVVFDANDVVNVGMRVLINEEARLIADFNQTAADGYIDLNEPLTTLPVAGDTVWINTSIPADDTNFFIEYVPAITLNIREDASPELIQKLGFRPDSIDLTEFTEVDQLAERLELFIKEQTTSSISGELLINLNFGSCEKVGYLAANGIPTVGEYITINDTLQGIENRTARIQALTVRPISNDGLYEMAVELGEFNKLEIVSNIIALKRGLGIVQDATSNVNYNVPPIFREVVAAIDDTFTVTNETGYPFYSGLYDSNISGNTGLTFEATDETLTVTSETGYPFYSGLYESNISGTRDYTRYNITYNGLQVTYNGQPITYTI